MKISFTTTTLVLLFASSVLATPVATKPAPPTVAAAAVVPAAAKKAAVAKPVAAAPAVKKPVAGAIIPAKKTTKPLKVTNPKAAAPATCKLSKRSSDKRDKLTRRTVAATQFHATCRTTAAQIEAEIKAKRFTLAPTRTWPNEFSWSGGLYLTPDSLKAELFGAYFKDCDSQGGVVIMELKLNTAGLRIKDLGSGNAADLYHTEMAIIGGTIAHAQGIHSGPGTTVPSFAQVQAAGVLNPGTFTNTVVDDAATRATLLDFQTRDIISGTVPFGAAQQEDANERFAALKSQGLPPFSPPFPQVVLVSDKAMAEVQFVATHEMSGCLAKFA